MTDMCKCCNCGNIFHISEAKRVEESRGEFWGAPCYETLYYSPCCTDDFVDVEDEEDV